MKSAEKHIRQDSEYYVYLPSLAAKETFFYPTALGHFHYEPGYSLHRSSFDSFLLMAIISGSLIVETEEKTMQVKEGQMVLLDCYKPHGYRSEEGWESIWIHFDGPQARAYVQMIHEEYGMVFRMKNPKPVLRCMKELIDDCSPGRMKFEPRFSRLITDILSDILEEGSCIDGQMEKQNSEAIQRVVSYMNDHFTEDISVDELAEQAMLSRFYFIRTFKKETGYTPHEYLINLRVEAAKYLLQTTDLAVKEVCYSTGFSCESAFCNTFRRKTGVSPARFRI